MKITTGGMNKTADPCRLKAVVDYNDRKESEDADKTAGCDSNDDSVKHCQHVLLLKPLSPM